MPKAGFVKLTKPMKRAQTWQNRTKTRSCTSYEFTSGSEIEKSPPYKVEEELKKQLAGGDENLEEAQVNTDSKKGKSSRSAKIAKVSPPVKPESPKKLNQKQEPTERYVALSDHLVIRLMSPDVNASGFDRSKPGFKIRIKKLISDGNKVTHSLEVSTATDNHSSTNNTPPSCDSKVTSNHHHVQDTKPAKRKSRRSNSKTTKKPKIAGADLSVPEEEVKKCKTQSEVMTNISTSNDCAESNDHVSSQAMVDASACKAERRGRKIKINNL